MEKFRQTWRERDVTHKIRCCCLKAYIKALYTKLMPWKRLFSCCKTATRPTHPLRSMRFKGPLGGQGGSGCVRWVPQVTPMAQPVPEPSSPHAPCWCRWWWGWALLSPAAISQLAKKPKDQHSTMHWKTEETLSLCSKIRHSQITEFHKLNFFFFFLVSIGKKIELMLFYFYKPSNLIRSSFFHSFNISPQATNISNEKKTSSPNKPSYELLIHPSLYCLWAECQGWYFSKNSSAPQCSLCRSTPL